MGLVLAKKTISIVEHLAERNSRKIVLSAPWPEFGRNLAEERIALGTQRVRSVASYQ